jgi:phage terminase large subunit-like protein
MTLGLTAKLLQRFLRLPPEEKAARLAGMTFDDLLTLDVAFELWAHPSQLPPDGAGWRTWLMMAGRGFGKTRAGAEWVHALAQSGGRRIALVAASTDEARKVLVEGVSGLLAIARNRKVKLKWEPSLNQLSWPKGSVATLYSGDNPDGLRGPEHHFAWCDELAKWRRPEESWDNLQMGLRLGPRARALVTTTPRPMPLLQRIRLLPGTIETGGRTRDNIALPKRFVDLMVATYGGTRVGRQELDGELMTEAEGSLFPRAMMEQCRCEAPAVFDRVVIAVDPPVSADGDACGIVVAGRRDGKLYVLADRSVGQASPERWARAVALAAEEWGAGHVVAEANQGGAMVKSVLQAADAQLRVKLVHASRGKSARAEPMAIRFEKGQALLAGSFPELEAELAGLRIGGNNDGPSRSPDRADACIWALTELSETRSGVPRVRRL